MPRRVARIANLKQCLSGLISAWGGRTTSGAGAERSGFLRKIRSAEEAMRIQRWLDSKELKAPH